MNHPRPPRKWPYFLSGLLLGALLFGFLPSAAADGLSSITAALNAVNITVNGRQVAQTGQDYTLANGARVPFSIVYQGTTYLPLRKIGEVFGKDIFWDGETSTAVVNDPRDDNPDDLPAPPTSQNVPTPTPTPIEPTLTVFPTPTQPAEIPITNLIIYSGKGFMGSDVFTVNGKVIQAENSCKVNRSSYSSNKTVYRLDKKYTIIKGTMAMADDTSNDAAHRLLVVMGDDQVLFRRYGEEGGGAYSFEIDVTSANELTIACGGSIRFYNVTILEGKPADNPWETPINRIAPYSGRGFNAGAFTRMAAGSAVKMFNMYDVPNLTPASNKTVYHLNGGYSALAGKAVFMDGSSDESRYRKLKITGDERVLFETALVKGAGVQDVNVNLEGVKELVIECGGSVCFFDVTVRR